MELSRREQEIHARIVGEFTKKDTDIAAALDVGPVRRRRYSPG